MNWETVQFVEIDKFCQKVLQKNFPNVSVHGDIKTFSGKELRGTVDIITGGFPCQPFSVAGQRKGRDDDRFIWDQMLRVTDESKPAFILAENVYGLLNIDGGYTVESICSDLESIGYERPVIFDSSSDFTGVPTMERHIWIISAPIGQRREGCKEIKNAYIGNERELQGTNQGVYGGWNLSETKFCRVGERVSSRLDKGDRHRIKALGNAIVPGVAYEIFKAISGVC